MENPNINVLVVDDFATMRKIIRNILKQIGFGNIFEADNGTAALSILNEVKVGLIVTDWNMPNMSGLELLQKIRADISIRDIPVLMVSAKSQKDQILTAVNAGADNYLVKPPEIISF
jgi:two-component system chemotaxis response regulator CheY